MFAASPSGLRSRYGPNAGATRRSRGSIRRLWRLAALCLAGCGGAPDMIPIRGEVLLDGQPMRVGAAPVGADGFVSRSLTERVTLHFTGENFASIAKAAHIRFRISFNASTSGGSFRSTDYVRIRGGAALNVSTAITEN